MKRIYLKDNSSWFCDIFFLLVSFSVLYFAFAAFRPLASPDEGRYTQIPLEMLRNADYVTPRLNDMVYFYKPPLFYWLQAGAIKLFGENMFSFRFANSAIALLGIFFTYCAARQLYGRTTGLFSAIFLATSIFYFGLGQVITLDMTVSVFIAGAMFSFIVALKKSGIWRGILILSFFAMSALAVMTKGLIGILIPSATIFLYALFIGVPSFFKKFKISDLYWTFAGVILFFAIALPWHILASIDNPAYDTASGFFSKNEEGQGFLWYYIVHEHFLRFIDPQTSDRAQPFWFFLVFAPFGFIPWLIFLPQAIKESIAGGYKKLRSENSEIIFFFIWTIFVVFFFSLSSSKLPAYILPIYPALSIIVGVYFARIWDSGNFEKLKIPQWVLISLGYLAVIALPIAYVAMERKGKLMELADDMLVVSIVSSVAMFTITSLALYFSIKRNYKSFWKAGIAGICILMIIFNPLARYFQRESARGLVDAIADVRKQNDTYVIAYNYSLFQDFPVWLGQTVYMIGDVPEEQSFGLMREREKFTSKFISDNIEFASLVDSAVGDVYVAIRDKDIESFKKDIWAKACIKVARKRNLYLFKIVK